MSDKAEGKRKNCNKGFLFRLFKLSEKVLFSPGFFVIITVFITFLICKENKRSAQAVNLNQGNVAVSAVREGNE